MLLVALQSMELVHHQHLIAFRGQTHYLKTMPNSEWVSKLPMKSRKNQLKQIIRENIAKVDEEEKEIYEAYLEDINMDTATKLLEIIPHTKDKTIEISKKIYYSNFSLDSRWRWLGL